MRFTKVETPFLDEKKKKKKFKCQFIPPANLNSPEDLASKYYKARDAQNTLIDTYVSTDEEIRGSGL